MTDPTPSADLPLSLAFRTATLSGRKPQHFDLQPDAAAREGIAALLGLIGLPELRFKGTMTPRGRRDIVLEAELSARVVQACSITLAPVYARLNETVLRRYLADYTFPEADEAEMPEDDTTEPLPEVIDAGAVALEALALALPPYPRAPGAELGEAVFAEPGTVPLTDADLRPFAGLGALKARLTEGEGGDGQA